MPLKVLDDSGLSYFWTKLKAWAVSLFAIDADVVHKTGNEIISGSKLFISDRINNNSDLLVKTVGTTRGATPSASVFSGINIMGSDYDGTLPTPAEKTLCAFGCAYRDSGILEAQVVAWRPSTTDNVNAQLRVGWDADGVTPHCFIPSTRDNPGSNDAVSWDWLPKDTRLVHTTGEEVVAGKKIFTAEIIRRNTNVVKGTNPSSTSFWAIRMVDKNGLEHDANTLGQLETSLDSSGVVKTYIRAIANTANSRANSTILCAYDTSNAIAYATAPSTRSDRTNGSDILTRDWIPSDTRIVHTTGDEIVAGLKSFSDEIDTLQSLVSFFDIYKGSVGPKFRGLYFSDASGVKNVNRRIGKVESTVDASGYSSMFLSAYKNESLATQTSQIVVGWDAGGRFAVAPSTRSDRTENTDIVTRDWIPSDTRIVHTTGNEEVDGVKTFLANIVQKWIGDYSVIAQRLNVSKGTNPSNTGKYAVLGAFESAGNLYVANRISVWTGYVTTSGDVYSSLLAYKNTASSSSASNFACAYFTSSDTQLQISNTIRPWNTNTYSLGDSSHRYTQVFAVNGTINTSDERLKHDIDYVSDSLLDVWDSIEWQQFKMLDSVQKKGRANARIHVGAIAQRVLAAFSKAGIDASRYGFFCHDEWEQTQEVRGPEGEILMPYSPAGDCYSLRYEEALCIEAAYMRRENARLKKRVADLEERLAALELKMS